MFQHLTDLGLFANYDPVLDSGEPLLRAAGLDFLGEASLFSASAHALLAEGVLLKVGDAEGGGVEEAFGGH